jgi:hypothetical protein
VLIHGEKQVKGKGLFDVLLCFFDQSSSSAWKISRRGQLQPTSRRLLLGIARYSTSQVAVASLRNAQCDTSTISTVKHVVEIDRSKEYCSRYCSTLQYCRTHHSHTVSTVIKIQSISFRARLQSSSRRISEQ